jgi:PAS domain S-box-containing protein
MEKERTERVISRSVNGSITVDNGGNLLMLNPEAERITGKRLSAHAGRPVWDGLGEGQMVTYAGASNAFSTADITVIGEDSTRRLIQASNAIINDIDGRMVGIFSVLSDITKYRELEAMKRDFVASVTHELRTPIVATKQALSNVLNLCNGIDEDSRKMLEISLRNTERLLRLVNDILDFSKMEAGRFKLNQTLIETTPFLKETTEGVRPFAESRGVSLVMNIHTALPRLFVDRDRTAQVVVNLLSNAIKFSSKGGAVTIESPGFERAGAEAFLKITVLDTGCGIKKEDQAKIFERFVQVGERQSIGGVAGTGLGLAISRSIIEMHGGKITLESEPGKGSAFTITVPMLPEDAAFFDNIEKRRPARL